MTCTHLFPKMEVHGNASVGSKSDVSAVVLTTPMTPPHNEGYFVAATESQVRQLTETYQASKAGGLQRPPAGNVRRVEAQDLQVNLDGLSGSELQALRDAARPNMGSLYYFTSGAGLWSRGGGQVKALVPYNLAAQLDEGDQAALLAAGEIIGAKTPAQVLKRARQSPLAGESETDAAKRILGQAKHAIDQLVRKAKRKPGALAPLDIKFVNVALMSAAADTYMPFDVWTSEQTHGAITSAINRLRAAYKHKTFHPEPAVNQTIHAALERYFEKADAAGDTHVFGYQAGFHALDPETGAPLTDTPRIGEGAGTAKRYMDACGQTQALKDRGLTTWMFENIEVASTDILALLGAHQQDDNDVSVVLVPQRDGYKGGSPFMVDKEGRENLELHEMCVLPEALQEGNAFFNSNTILQSIDLAPPSDLGFEVKNAGTEVRVKMNAGDITKEAKTAGIGGRIGQEYENFKTYGEFLNNGGRFLETHQANWASMVKDVDIAAPPAGGALVTLRCAG